MADISRELAAIMAAIYGKDVRKSIHDAIETINDVAEKTLTVGTTVHAGDSAANFYENSLYINASDWNLLKSDGSQWVLVDNIEGNGIDDITGPVTVGLVDTYTINFTKNPTPKTFNVTNARSIASITGPTTVGLVDTYTITFNDGSTLTYDVTNGLGIVSIALKQTVGLTDTYTITYTDGSTQDYDVVNGKDGNTVLRGNEVTGQAVLPTQFTLSVKCQTGDTYINTSGYVYTCTQGAAAGGNSLWKYDFAMTGGGGAQVLSDLNDVDTTGVLTGQYLRYDGSQFVPVTSSGSGHTMLPDPAVDPRPAKTFEQNAVDAILAGRADGYDNEDVASLHTISWWSNVFRKTYIVSGIAGSSTPIGRQGIGKWNVDGSDETGWIEIEALKGIHNYDHEIKITYDPAKSGMILKGGYIIDDTTGKMAIKFANTISEADTHTAVIGIEIIIRRDGSTPVSF